MTLKKKYCMIFHNCSVLKRILKLKQKNKTVVIDLAIEKKVEAQIHNRNSLIPSGSKKFQNQLKNSSTFIKLSLLPISRKTNNQCQKPTHARLPKDLLRPR